MLVALALSLAVLGGAALPPPAPLAVSAVPPEEGAVMLPERSTYQAVVADLDGDGVRELVRLVVGDRGAIALEAWGHAPSGWEQVAGEIEVIPRRVTGTQGNVVYGGAPVRLLVRSIGDEERVTVVRQPRFDEPLDDADAECCLLLHDLELADGTLGLRPVASPQESVDAILAIDLDGDGTDELLATRALRPRGDISFPSRGFVFRWDGTEFAPPVVSDLAVGSGDAPFVLGDTDGRPGLEAGIISTRGQSTLSRVVRHEGDILRTEDSDLVVSDARAVPIDGGRGVAVVGPLTGLAVYSWAPGEPVELVASRELPRGRTLGIVEARNAPALVVERSEPEALLVLALPGLTFFPGVTVTRSPAAAVLVSSPLRPYVGPLPGGGPAGEEAILYRGHLLPSPVVPDTPFASLGDSRFAALAGAEPVGLAGPRREWLALLHGTPPLVRLDPAGGRLDPPALRAGSGVSLAPLDAARTREVDDGRLDPPVTRAVPVGEHGVLGVGAEGFSARVTAPPGSRVYVGDADPSVIGGIRVVPASGSLEVPLVPPEVSTPNPRYRAALSVVTPAGHAYLASWEIRALLDPPPLSAEAVTHLGSTAVEVRGRTSAVAAVTIGADPVPVDDGGHFTGRIEVPPWPTDVTIVATDPLGNRTQTTVSAIGLFDYRGLPWVPIAVALVGIAAAVLYLRVPRPGEAPAREDDATLEELDPD